MTGLRTRLIAAATRHMQAQVRERLNGNPAAAEEHKRRYEQAMTGLESLTGESQ